MARLLKLGNKIKKILFKTNAKNTKQYRNAKQFKVVFKNKDSLFKSVKTWAVKPAAIGAGIGGTAYTIDYLSKYIVNYQKEHSGCFSTENNKRCKIVEASCCNRETTEKVPACKTLTASSTICSNYTDDHLQDCCNNNCKTGVCHRASVGEALTTFITDYTGNYLSYLKYGLIGFILIIIVIISLKIVNLIRYQ